MTVEASIVWYARLVTANVFDIVVSGHYESDEEAASPIVFTRHVRQHHSSASLSLVIPVLLRAISVPPP